MEDITNILNDEDEFNEKQFMNYVTGNLLPEDAYEMEKMMNDSSFINDAAEGLQQFSSPEKMDAYAQQLNENLQQRLTGKKRKKKKNIKSFSREITAVIIVIVLILIAYAVIEMIHK